MDALKNFAYSSVATAPSPATSGTSLIVTAGTGTYFPAAPFDVTIWPSGQQPTNSNAEICRVTAVATDTLTITRAQYGTTAQSITTGYQIAQTVDANLLSQLAPLSGATFTGAVSGTTFTGSGEIAGTDLKATGLTGATAGNVRIAGSTTSGSPTSGTFAVGDVVVDQTGTIWICTTAGTPGTWTNEISNSLVVRSATATAGTGEFTIFGTSGTSGQTITLPASAVNGALYQIKNLSAYTVNILGGTNSISVSGTVYSASTPYTIPLNAAYTFVYSGGIWYCMVTTDHAQMAGILPVANGGTGLTTLGTSGQVLTVNSGATGLTYSTPSGGASPTSYELPPSFFVTGLKYQTLTQNEWALSAAAGGGVTAQTPTKGVVYYTAVYIPAGTSLTTAYAWNFSIGTGQNVILGLYSSTTQLGYTSAIGIATASKVNSATMTATSTGSLSNLAGGVYFIALLIQNSTTTSGTWIGANSLWYNQTGMGPAVVANTLNQYSQTLGSGLNALPSSISGTPTALTSFVYWMGLS